MPVLVYVRTAYTKDRPVRLSETVFAGDRNRLVYELGQLDALYERDGRCGSRRLGAMTWPT